MKFLVSGTIFEASIIPDDFKNLRKSFEESTGLFSEYFSFSIKDGNSYFLIDESRFETIVSQFKFENSIVEAHQKNMENGSEEIKDILPEEKKNYSERNDERLKSEQLLQVLFAASLMNPAIDLSRLFVTTEKKEVVKKKNSKIARNFNISNDQKSIRKCPKQQNFRVKQP